MILSATFQRNLKIDLEIARYFVQLYVLIFYKYHKGIVRHHDNDYIDKIWLTIIPVLIKK